MDTQGVAFQLWARVESARVDRGLTASEIAEQVGVPRNTIRRLKTQPTKPAASTVHKIADGLKKLGEDITRRDAETLAGIRPPEPSHAGYISTRDAIKADTTYTEAQRAAMLELAEFFARANAAAKAPDGEPES